MTNIHEYQNRILLDALDVTSTDDLLEFAIELDWIKMSLGDETFTLIKSELHNYKNMPWRDALHSAVVQVCGTTKAGWVCPPHQS